MGTREDDQFDPDHPVVGLIGAAVTLLVLAVVVGFVSFYFDWWWGFIGSLLLVAAVIEGSVLEAAELPAKLKDYRRDRRAKRGACLACGYDLRGSPKGGGCPECGAKRPMKKPRRAKRRQKKNRQDST